MQRQRTVDEVPEVDGRLELRKVEEAVDQLERAELYVVAAIELELADWRQRRVLESLRATVALTRRSLTRPTLIEQAGLPIR